MAMHSEVALAHALDRWCSANGESLTRLLELDDAVMMVTDASADPPNADLELQTTLFSSA